MSEPAITDAPSEHPGKVPVPVWLARLCRIFAGIGGVTLLAMMCTTVASVTLRGVVDQPIPGDFELVEMGSAIAIFCFLPWCQVSGGNVLVDFFTSRARASTNHLLEALGDLVYLLIAGLICWRLVLGGMDLRLYGEQSMVLRLPIWWGFVVIVPAAALLVLTCLTTMIGHLRRARA
jgi:TRAP-type C4-dicarboxylate transport system permease small subunit